MPPVQSHITMIYNRRFVASIVVGLAATVFLTSAVNAQNPYQPKPLRQLLANTDWVSLPLPDSRMGPGAVIRVTEINKNVDVRWLGDFKNCGITGDGLHIERGKYPPLGVGENLSVDLSLTANFLSKIGLGAEASKVGGAVLTIEQSGGDAIDLLALTVWLAKPGNFQTISDACTKILAQDNVYLVAEAFRISKGSYDLFDKSGAKLTFDAATLSQGIKGQIGASLSSTGTLTVNDDFYFAVRRVKQLSPGTFVTLGSPTANSEADELLAHINRIE